jgi:hypothetical protein
MYGGRYTDLCYGYNAFWRHSLEILNLDSDGFEIETMINIRVLRAGLRIVEVPSFESRRVWGNGRLRTIPDGWRVLKTIFRERRFPGRRYPPHYVRPEFLSVREAAGRGEWPWMDGAPTTATGIPIEYARGSNGREMPAVAGISGARE